MPTLIELTAEIVQSHAGSTEMTSDQLLDELQKVYTALQSLEGGAASPGEPKIPTLTVKQAFKKNEVICMVCGKGGFKTLKKHLAVAHELNPRQYRKQFGIPATQSLAAKSYSESRKQMAIDRGLADGLAKARAIRAANAEVKKAAPVPAKRVKPAVPAVKVKAAVPAKVQKAK